MSKNFYEKKSYGEDNFFKSKINSHLVSIVDLYSFVLEKILQAGKIIIADKGGQCSVAKRYHRVGPVQSLRNKFKTVSLILHFDSDVIVNI